MLIVPKWREGWSPRYEEKKLIGRFGIERVSRWSWQVIQRIGQEMLKSPSPFMNLHNVGYPIENLVKMSDKAIREELKKRSEAISVRV